MTSKLSLEENLKLVLAEVEENKIVDNVTVIAVSKYSEFSEIKMLYDLGHRDFGENRIESLEIKADHAITEGLDEIRWHFIGNIQSSKIKKNSNIQNLVAIHSLDKLKHLKEFYKYISHPVDFFIQFNTSGEEEKSGLNDMVEFAEFATLISDNKDSKFTFKGLMTMGKIRTDDLQADADICFKKLLSLRDKIDKDLSLSMGMSSDFSIALRNGATHIRVGRSLFK